MGGDAAGSWRSRRRCLRGFAPRGIRRLDGQGRRSAKRRVTDEGTVHGTLGETRPVGSAGDSWRCLRRRLRDIRAAAHSQARGPGSTKCKARGDRPGVVAGSCKLCARGFQAVSVESRGPASTTCKAPDDRPGNAERNLGGRRAAGAAHGLVSGALGAVSMPVWEVCFEGDLSSFALAAFVLQYRGGGAMSLVVEALVDSPKHRSRSMDRQR